MSICTNFSFPTGRKTTHPQAGTAANLSEELRGRDMEECA